MAKRTALSKGEKILLVSVFLFVALVIAFVVQWNRINATPVVHIPTPVMPNPNAFDYYPKAGEMTKPVSLGAYSMGFAEAINFTKPGMTLARGPRTKTVPPKPLPGGSMPMGAGAVAPSLPRSAKITPTLADMQALVAKNAPAFALLRGGFPYEYREPPSRSFNHLFPHYAKYRNLARGLSVAAYTAGELGDWNGAVNYCLDSVQFGAETQHNSGLLGMLVGIACQAIGRTHAWGAIDHLEAAQARAAVRRIEHIAAREFPYAGTLQEEKWSMQASLLEIFRMPGWRKESMQYFGGSGRPLVDLKVFFISKQEIMDNFTTYMDAMIANAKLPYAAPKKMPPLPDDPVSQQLLPIFDRAWMKKAVTETQNRLLMVSLALRAYKLEHGGYPADLNALAPGYLKALPDDPFALKGTFHYQRRGKAYVLYSLGPDKHDDGGTPSKDGVYSAKGTPKGASPSIVFRSTGDIVAGVNTR